MNNTLVFDIGKTNIKSILFNYNGKIILEYNNAQKFTKKINRIKIIKIDKIFDLVIKQIKIISKKFIINKIIFTTHASTFVLNLNDNKNIYLPVIDYENTFDKNFEKNYFKYQKCKFSETLTPNLPRGLIIAKSIYYYMNKMKKEFYKIQSIIFYPQYFAWRLTGIKTSEITYLGCHSDLFSFKKNKFSTFVYKNNLEKKIPKIYKSWRKVGILKKEILKETNLKNNCSVYCGGHDSSLAYYLYEKKYKKSFTLISTGTWIVIFNKSMNSKFFDEKKKVFAKLSVLGEKLPVLRFMGGREYSNIVKKHKNKIKTKSTIENFLKNKIFVIPSFGEDNPFSNMKGKITNQKKISSFEEYNNLASLYVALITDYCLEQIRSENSVIIDGGFIKNTLFLKYLSALRYKQNIFLNKDSHGTAVGAFLLCNKQSRYKLNLTKVEKSKIEVINEYKKQWLNLI